MSKEKRNKNPTNKMIYNELLDLKATVIENRTEVQWLKKLYQTLDTRSWYVVTAIIISILLQICFFLVGS